MPQRTRNMNKHSPKRESYTLTLVFLCIIAALALLHPASIASATDVDLVPLTEKSVDGNCLYPTWSPDGVWIAYQGNSSLWIMHGDGSNKTRLPVEQPVLHPGWSPAGDEIAFSRSEGTGHDIWVIKSDGDGATRLTESPGDDLFIAWSPDGTEIAFYSNRSGSRELWVMKADGSEQHRIFDGEVYNHPSVNFKPELSWSPRGDRIVLTKTSSEIWIMDLEQETLTPLISEGWTYTNPVWSPDGDLIAFSTPLKGIETIRPDGSGRRLLNDDDCAGGMALAWSPSGEKIAYSSCGQVKVMNRDGSGQQTVKSDIVPFPLELCWSPTGDTIAMSDGYTVYLIALDRESSDSAALTSQNNKTSQVPGFIAVSAMFALILVGSRISVKKRAISKRSNQKSIPSQIRSEKTAIKEKRD